MKRSRTVVWAAAGSALVLATALVANAATPAEQRREVMKLTGTQMRDSTAFISGQSPWDAAKVKTLMDGIAGNAKKLHGLYPAGSGSEPKSEAAPAIWTNKADFDKRLTEMEALAKAAGKAKTADEFKPAFQKVGGTCKSCHDIYRKKKA